MVRHSPMRSSPTIEHVSDTALWVAAYRAQETERSDALFRDPWAAQLVGDRGRKIARVMAAPEIMALAMAVRTVAIDRLLEEALARGADLVLNLGAGLDTRPYRMALPESVTWVEIDFPEMIRHKEEVLASDRPRCPVLRYGVDLSDDSARAQVLREVSAKSKKIVVLTEGVIPYLTREQAERLALDLRQLPSFLYWIQDYQRGGWRSFATFSMARKLRQKSPFLFDVRDPFQFFEGLGWKALQDIHLLDEAERIGRPLHQMMAPWTWPLKWMPARLREFWNRRFGYAMLERSISAENDRT
jgi:methyltransferase (TIGR00027 family)